jgi:hypothetical protein
MPPPPVTTGDFNFPKSLPMPPPVVYFHHQHQPPVIKAKLGDLTALADIAVSTSKSQHHKQHIELSSRDVRWWSAMMTLEIQKPAEVGDGLISMPQMQVFSRDRVDALIRTSLWWLDHIWVRTTAPACPPNMRVGAIFDLDDSLCYITADRRTALHPHAVALYHWCIDHRVAVIIVTARPDLPWVREYTETTLRSLNICWNALYLMPVDAFPPGSFSHLDLKTPTTTIAPSPLSPPPTPSPLPSPVSIRKTTNCSSAAGPALQARASVDGSTMARFVCSFKTHIRRLVLNQHVVLFNLGNHWSDVLSNIDAPRSRTFIGLGDDFGMLMLAAAHDSLLAIKLPATVL